MTKIINFFKNFNKRSIKKIKSCPCIHCGVCTFCKKEKLSLGIKNNGHPCNGCAFHEACSEYNGKEKGNA